MEIAQLEAFERVVRDGSFTRAAEAMDLTQPAVSMRISTLEAELGGALFERRGRRLTLTPLGECFMPYAQRMLAVLADSREAVDNFRKGKSGTVKIAAPTPFVLSFLVDVLADFRRHYPTVDVLIRERNKTTIFEMLHDGVINLGLVNAPVFDQRLIQLAHFDDPIRAVVGARHPLARYRHDILTIDRIYDHTIFRVSMFPAMTAFIDSVVEHGRGGSGGAVIAVPMVMALKLVSMGQGVTFLPQSYVKPAIESGELVYLQLADMPPLVSEAVIIAQRDRNLDNSHQAFLATLKKCWENL